MKYLSCVSLKSGSWCNGDKDLDEEGDPEWTRVVRNKRRVVLTASKTWANGCVIQKIFGGDEGSGGDVQLRGPGTRAG